MFLTDYLITFKNYSLIRQKFSVIRCKMDTKHSGLLGLLYQNGVLDDEEKQDLDEIVSSSQRNERLLYLLNRKSSQQFDDFVSALHETGQDHILQEGNCILETLFYFSVVLVKIVFDIRLLVFHF